MIETCLSFSDMNITFRTKKDDNEGMTLLEEQVVWSLKYKCYGFNPLGWKKDGRRGCLVSASIIPLILWKQSIFANY